MSPIVNSNYPMHSTTMTSSFYFLFKLVLHGYWIINVNSIYTLCLNTNAFPAMSKKVG